MQNLILTEEIISEIKKEAADSAHCLMGADLVEAVLYGSCARGDYTADSDIDIALVTRCGRMESKKYDDGLNAIYCQKNRNIYCRTGQYLGGIYGKQ